ncbi:MAG: protein O-mannosyl-transferase family, partial [Bacteroidia bacterium]
MLLLFLAVVYITERSPEPALGDSLSFSVAALQGFDYSTNATNHFLYINLMHLLSLITGFKYSHLAFQLLSLIPSILTLVMLSKILKQLRIEPTIRFLGMFLLGFSFTYWRHAEIIEVYALNLLITSFAIYWFVLWHGNRRRKYLYYSSFILGLAMLLHVQQVLYIPFLMYWCFLAFSFNFKHWLKTFLLFALPASFLFVPPIVFNTNTIESIFFDNSFQDQVLGLNVQTILKGIVKSVGLLIFNFGPLAALLILAAFKVKTEKTLHWG